jgi:hypothetical protein
MVAEIPGFDLSNRLSDLTTSLFSSDGIGKLIFKKVKKFKLNNSTIIENRTPDLWCANHDGQHLSYSGSINDNDNADIK